MYKNLFIDRKDRFVTHDRRLVLCTGHPYILYTSIYFSN